MSTTTGANGLDPARGAIAFGPARGEFRGWYSLPIGQRLDSTGHNQEERTMKCDFYSGCKCEAKWRVLHLWGQRIVRHACDKHKPGQRERPDGLKKLPAFYECTPVVGK